ncbi:unnamed protein product [Chrysoparadoxa australica]
MQQNGEEEEEEPFLDLGGGGLAVLEPLSFDDVDSALPDTPGEGCRSRTRSQSFYEDNEEVTRDLDAAVALGEGGDKGFKMDVSPLQANQSSSPRNQALKPNELRALSEGLLDATYPPTRRTNQMLQKPNSSEPTRRLVRSRPGGAGSNVEDSDDEEGGLRMRVEGAEAGASAHYGSGSIGGATGAGSANNAPQTVPPPPVPGYSAQKKAAGALPGGRKIKLLMLGDSGVGKSSIMERFALDTFNPSLVGTVGVDFKLKTVTVDGEQVVVQVWDTAGQERFHKITRAYYRGSHGIVLVYDLSDSHTLDGISYWMDNINANASGGVETLLVGNKLDLVQVEKGKGSGGRAAAKATTRGAAEGGKPMSGAEVAELHGVSFFEASAKTGVNVEDAFMCLVRDIVLKDKAKEPQATAEKKGRDKGKKKSSGTRPAAGTASRPTEAKGKLNCTVS